MKIRFFESTGKDHKIGGEYETFLCSINSTATPLIGELVMINDDLKAYRVIDICTILYDEEPRCEILLFEEE